MLWWGQSALEELIEKATSELLPAGQEDLVLHLEISDQIRSKKVNAKDAMRSLKRRLEHKNPNVQLATLSLVDTCVKNSGDQFVREVASREFMDQLASMIRAPTGCNPDVKNKILGIIQTWHMASRNNPALGYISDTYRLLQAEGHVFPPVGQPVDSILLETAAPPEWTDSDVCERCRTAFTMTNRKHHCRQCGKTFCQDCSAKNMPLPHIGIDEEVRVCDGCYIKLKLAKVAKKDALPPLPGLRPATSQQQQQPATSSSRQASGDAQDDTFDEDMKKAIEMSLKEAEQYKSGYGAGYTPSQPTSTNPPATTQAASTNEEEDDPDLAAAIAASLRDMQVSSPSYAPSNNTWQQSQQYQTYNSDEISRTEMENIELFSTLIARIHARGGNISNDPQITKLYTQIGALQPKLVKTMQDVIEKHKIVVELHDKMNAAVRAYDLLLEQRVAGAHARASQPYTSNNATYYNPAAVASAPAPSPYQYGAQIPATTGYDYTAATGQMYPPAPQTAQPAATTNGYPPVSSSPAASAPQFQPSTYAATTESQQQQQPYQQMYPPQPQAAAATPGGYYYPPTPTQQQQPYPYQMPPGQQQQQQQQPKPRVEESPLIDLS